MKCPQNTATTPTNSLYLEDFIAVLAALCNIVAASSRQQWPLLRLLVGVGHG